MILVTVGSQLPFDRLLHGLDIWCQDHSDERVLAQIADPGPHGYYPEHAEWERFLDPEIFDQRFIEARLIVAHAGMGSIIGALMAAKPIVIMPRRADLGEHRNDHQLATVEKFRDRPNVYVADDEQALPSTINAALQQDVSNGAKAAPFADTRLIEAVREVVLGRPKK